MFRSLILFVHVVGVLMLFVGLGLEWLSLQSLRRATTRAEALSWVRANRAVPRASAVAVAIILASGFYLGARIGVLDNAWMHASYAAIVLMAIVGAGVARPRLAAIGRAAADPGERGLPALRAAASAALLLASLRLRVAFGLAVVYLMIAKPDSGESLAVLGLASAIAIAISVPGRQLQSAAG